MSRVTIGKILKSTLLIPTALVALVLIVVAMLYLPPVQRWAKDIALERINDSGAMRISIDDLRLRFPLKLSLEGVTVENAPGDTMATVGHLSTSARVLPLLRGIVAIANTTATSVNYRQGTTDSLLCLRANIDTFTVDAASMHLRDNIINIGHADATGGKLRLTLKSDTTTAAVDTTAATPLTIHANCISLHNIDYSMSMPGVVDTLTASLGSAVLADGLVSLGDQRIQLRSLVIDTLDAAYLYSPTSDTSATSTTDTATTTDTAPWTVTADTISLNNGNATYALSGGTSPAKGLDLNHISANGISILVTDFYNCGTNITVPLQRLHATERCGISIDASGTYAMDSAGMSARDFKIATAHSSLSFDAYAGINADTPIDRAPLAIDATLSVGTADIASAYPSLAAIVRQLPRRTPLQATLSGKGTMNALTIDRARLWMQRCFDISVSGHLADISTPSRISGSVDMHGTLANSGFIRQTLFDAQMRHLVDLPALTIDAGIDMTRGDIDGFLTATTGAGRLALDASWRGRTEAYSLDLQADSLPVRAFLPNMGIGSVSGNATISGNGLDIHNHGTALQAEVEITRAEYVDRVYSNISLQASLANGHAEALIQSANEAANFDMSLDATVDRHLYTWNAAADMRALDLRALGMADTTMEGCMMLSSSGSFNPDNGNIDATADINNLRWSMPGVTLTSSPIHAEMAATDSGINADLDNKGLHASFSTPQCLDSVLLRLQKLSPLLQHLMVAKRIDVEALQHTIPTMQLSLEASGSNILSDYLRSYDTSLRTLRLNAANDSLLSLNAEANNITTGTTAIDNVTMTLQQRAKYLVYNIEMNNRPGTFDEFAYAKLHGYLADDKMSLFARQRNIEGETGYHLGLVASTTDSTATIKFTPYSPVIAYKNWTINADNSIDINFNTRHLDANIDMDGSGSCIRLFTEHADSVSEQEDVILKVENLQLADWMSISPFAPPIKGALNADMRFGWDLDSIGGSGTIGLRDLVYGHERVGSFDLGVDLSTNSSKVVRADLSLLVDSVKVITACGAINDSTAITPFNLDFSMVHLPLRILNPFLPSDMARMSGMLNGEMAITGNLAHPIFNGYLAFDSTAVTVPMMGSTFRFAGTKVPVVDNVATFNDYTISALNDNPLHIDGTVTFTDINAPKMNLSMTARNMQIVGNKRSRSADIYGKAFIDADATVRGSLAMMNVNAALTLLRATDVTYVMGDATSTAITSSQSTADMVRFVNFTDTTATTIVADTIQPTAIGMALNATLNVQSGATINVDLSTDGKNKVQLQGEGRLNYTSSALGDDRLTGRYTISSGFVRYSMPMISEKLFNFNDGSYVAFTGDILNPTLNISATDKVKANVSTTGQNSRAVNFNVGLDVTGTLSNMDVAFDLSSTDDLTVQNEIQSMSAEQRANQAMNLLLYNVYTGANTKSTSNISGNALYSFLTSQINTWAANNIHGVDLSFGIDQYDTTTASGSSSTATSYSYRVSKSLFNDRFKIVVGGNYSTDADTDENFSQNLINDISFEYMLNHSGSMVVKIFRHTGYESILEGEVTQTGVGFVYRHKLRRLSDMFRFLRRKERSSTTTTAKP